MNSMNYNEAAEYFSIILLLSPVNPVDILIKRSIVLAWMESWDEVLSDADQVFLML